MVKYNFDSLLELNESYHRQHRLTEDDLDMANMLVGLIEATRRDYGPQPGDIIEYTSKHGDYYANAHVEQNREGQLYICENPYVPFVTADFANFRVLMNTSGGAWANIPANLKLIGKRSKSFHEFGHCGMKANGAVYFNADVNVWEYVSEGLEFTTKTHDRFHVSIVEPKSPNDYRYLISGGAFGRTAFRTEEEYLDWLETFRGVERPAAWGNAKTVWTFKQHERYVPQEEYDAVTDAVLDKQLSNGEMRVCKRVYEGTSVTTYVPHKQYAYGSL